MSRGRTLLAAVLLAFVALGGSARAENWSVARVNHMLLSPPGGVTVEEMSGVTYVGPTGGAHRFIAAEEVHQRLVQFDVTFSDAGAIAAISNITSITIVQGLDFEGIAFTNPARNSVFLSEENNPGVREVNLATGQQLQAVAIPPVFTANKRVNRGFESLTRTLNATTMWTANEQALTVDGPEATASQRSPVRLLRLDVAGNMVTAGSQYVYEVEPIHGTSTLGSPQSGLSELTAMPDGTLLALERSVVVGSPVFLNRIYEIDFTDATEVSGAAFVGGLDGQSYVTVGKTLAWSGAADGSSGQNLEGLTLGPRLPNGDWVLLGVVDDNPTDSDVLSMNTVVAFVASPITSADFNDDGDVDGADFMAWQRGLGTTIGAGLADGDGDRDGDVDAADLGIWKSAFTGPVHPTPEPLATELAAPAIIWLSSFAKRTRGRPSRRSTGQRPFCPVQ